MVAQLFGRTLDLLKSFAHLLILILMCSSPAYGDRVSVSADGLRLQAEYLPPVKNSGPAVVLLHGCGGLYTRKGEISSRILRTANWLQELGFGVLMLDSFSARGIRSTCVSKSSQAALDEVARADDAEAALAWLKKRKEVDGGRLGVMGWSHGADAVLDLLRRNDPGIRVAVTFYPACRKLLQHAKFRVAAPALVLIGDRDEWTPASDCKALAQRSGQDLFHVVTFPGALHDFDLPSQSQYTRTDVPNIAPQTDGVITGPNPDAALDAYLRTFKWFSRWFDPARMMHGIPPVNMGQSPESLVLPGRRASQAGERASAIVPAKAVGR